MLSGKNRIDTHSVYLNQAPDPLPPSPAQRGTDVDCYTRLLCRPVRRVTSVMPVLGGKAIQGAVRNESASAGIHMPIANLALLMGIESLRHDQIQFVLCSGHGHVQQPPF